MEMEMIHRQEELEHLELERALLLSLAVEEERLRVMMSDMKISEPSREEYVADEKASPAESKMEAAEEVHHHHAVDAKSAAPVEDKASAPSSSSMASSTSNTSPSKKVIKPVTNFQPDTFAEIKPLKMKTFNALPLPGIKAGSDSDPSQLVADLAEKKRTTEAIIRKGAEQLQQQRKTEEELRTKMNGVDPEEAERRAKHMKEQRELLLAKKKAERERKVQAEDERKRKMADENPAKEESGPVPSSPAADSKQEADEIAEMRRATMRMALARRLKMDLLEGNDDAKGVEQNPLRANLQKVEQLREDNRKREQILTKQLAAMSSNH